MPAIPFRPFLVGEALTLNLATARRGVARRPAATATR